MAHRNARCVALLLAVALGAAPLAGCETAPTKETTGTVVGGIVGAVLGSQVGGGSGRYATGAIGAILGGAIGKSIGKHMDANDRLRVSQALETNATGQTTRWSNDQTRTTHAITPSDPYIQDGKQCRRFVQEAIVDGQPTKMSGTACKRPTDGTWEESA